MASKNSPTSEAALSTGTNDNSLTWDEAVNSLSRCACRRHELTNDQDFILLTTPDEHGITRHSRSGCAPCRYWHRAVADRHNPRDNYACGWCGEPWPCASYRAAS